jgi:hypothetical protein
MSEITREEIDRTIEEYENTRYKEYGGRRYRDLSPGIQEKIDRDILGLDLQPEVKASIANFLTSLKESKESKLTVKELFNQIKKSRGVE